MTVSAGGDAERARRGGAHWHRYHYAVGVFLAAYGVTVLAGSALRWDDRREEMEIYFSGSAGTLLLVVKAFEALLLLCAAAALALRRDVLLVPPLAGWMAGFAMFAVLDVFAARWGGLVEHLCYLAGFVVLLFLSYGFSAMAQAAGAAGGAAPGSGPGTGRLTRTQELALAAMNRLPRPS
ncbi:hypothetical protein [Spirillospora albida]|uniref:hypothetical protein n=1 Tax=Spirillospora albida TaxID=58123 RepID=UPI0004BF1E1D|nr:hypothetical protein [Spirillospora albida]